MSMSVSLPPTKLVEYRDLLGESAGRVSASEMEFQSLMGTLLHVWEVTRSGKLFVRRMVNQFGMPPGQPWEEKFRVFGGTVRAKRENTSN